MFQRRLECLTVAGILRCPDIVQYALARKLQTFQLTLASHFFGSEFAQFRQSGALFSGLDLGFHRLAFPSARHASSVALIREPPLIRQSTRCVKKYNELTYAY